LKLWEDADLCSYSHGKLLILPNLFLLCASFSSKPVAYFLFVAEKTPSQTLICDVCVRVCARVFFLLRRFHDGRWFWGPPESGDCFVFCELDLVIASLFEVFFYLLCGIKGEGRRACGIVPRVHQAIIPNFQDLWLFCKLLCFCIVVPAAIQDYSVGLMPGNWGWRYRPSLSTSCHQYM
jgi:hypothetical protein